MTEGYEAVRSILEENQIFAGLFDRVRLVDPEGCSLLMLDECGALTETGVRCTEIWGSEHRCLNCTSVRAFYGDESIVKLETLGGSVLLIFSVPAVHRGRRIVVEMIKDVSSSMRPGGGTDTYNLVSELNRLANTDALTELRNRRFMDEQLPTLLRTCEGSGRPVFGAMLDLDDFKRVNDLYGHAVGDRLLILVADVMQAPIRRASDWVARYGGEEFFLCMPGMPLEDGLQILEGIRREVGKLVVDAGDVPVKVTISAGACLARQGDDATGFTSRCDRLLYRAKTNGKNRIESEG